jgi:hypothetical protein
MGVQDTHTLHLCNGEMTPTLQDVAMLTSLPKDGAPVIGCRGSIHRDVLRDHLLRQVPPTSAYEGDCIKLTWLNLNFKTSMTDVIEDQLVMYARAYILHMFGRLIFTSTVGNVIPLFFETLLKDS